MELVTPLISLIALICFFVLVADTSAIKKSLKFKSRREYKIAYHMYLETGNSQLAYEALISMFYFDLENDTSGHPRQNIYNKLVLQYEPNFKALEQDVPDFF